MIIGSDGDAMNIDDINFDLLSADIRYINVDICGLVKKMKSKKRKMFKISREKSQLNALIGEPPKTDECFKMLSVGGGFSSLGIIAYIGEREVIEEMYVSTFRIGKAHFDTLVKMHEKGRLKKAYYITSTTQERTDDTQIYKGTTYNYFDYIVKMCSDIGWVIKTLDNHSKLILIRTRNNFYVIETSSNLNENPKMEQFNWENDKSLYAWYEDLFIELLK